MTFKRAPRQATQYTGANPTPRSAACVIADTKARLVVPLPKAEPYRSEPYRRYVASLPCIHCGREGISQAAHSDTGKGMGIKSCDSTCIPLCADLVGRRGCHSIMGASGMLTRHQRRHVETAYVLAVQKRAAEEGHWPHGWTREALL